MIDEILASLFGSLTEMILPGIFTVLAFLLAAAAFSDSIVVFPIEDVPSLSETLEELEARESTLSAQIRPTEGERTVINQAFLARQWLGRVNDSDSKFLENELSSASTYKTSRTELQEEFNLLSKQISAGEDLREKYSELNAERLRARGRVDLEIERVREALETKRSIKNNLSTISSNFFVLTLLGTLLGVIIERLMSSLIIYRRYDKKYLNSLSQQNRNHGAASKELKKFSFDVLQVKFAKRHLIESCLNNAAPFFLLCCSLGVYLALSFDSHIGGALLILFGFATALILYQSGYIFYRSSRRSFEEQNAYQEDLASELKAAKQIWRKELEKTLRDERRSKDNWDTQLKKAIEEGFESAVDKLAR